MSDQCSTYNIENLCEFLCRVMMRGEGGIFWPQNAEYSSTCEIVKEIARVSDHRIWISKVFNPAVIIASKCPEKIGGLCNKAFGNLTYDMKLSKYGFEYQLVKMKSSICKTEKQVL